jgi:hypothetical protein
MKKSEVLVFSLLGVLLGLTSFVKNYLAAQVLTLGTPFDGKSIPDEVYHRIKILDSYEIFPERVFRVLFVILLLYIGWKIAYGFLGLRYIIPVALVILLIPALIEFAFLPNDRSVWLFLCQDIIRAAAWIAVMKIYRFSWVKTQFSNNKDISV